MPSKMKDISEKYKISNFVRNCSDCGSLQEHKGVWIKIKTQYPSTI